MLLAPAATAWRLQSDDSPRRFGGLDTRVTAVVAVPAAIGLRTGARATGTIAPRTIGSPVRWFPLLVVLWLTGVAVLTTRTAVGWLRVRRIHRDTLALTPSRWQTTATRLAAVFGIGRRIHVAESDFVDAPAVVGWFRPVVVIPVAAFSNLSTAQVEAILAHELAHVRRHDYLVNLVQTAAETLLFYHPAVWWLSQRLRVEREHCCDDVALSVCGDALEYAEALAAIETRRAVPAMALAANAGSLVHRVRRILGTQTTTPPTGWVVAPVLAAVLMASAVGIAQVRSAPPAPPVPPAAPSEPSARARSGADASTTREFRMQSKDWLRRFDVRVRGEMTFSDDLTDVATLADGAYLSLRDRSWFTVRSIEVSGERGVVTRKFWVSGVQQPWDPEGRNYLADRLPSLVRRTGVAAEARTRQILSTSGVSGVLDEIKLLESDYARRRYYQELLKTAQIDGPTAGRVVSSAADTIRSGYELRQTLTAAAPHVARDAEAVQAFVEAAASISSDYEHRQALDVLAEAPGLIAAAGEPIARSAARIGSDFEKRQALSRLLANLPDPSASSAVLDAAETIGSDFECATLLIAFTAAHALDGPAISVFFKAVDTLGSDYERGRVLKAVARSKPLAPPVLEGILTSVRGMQSDYEQAEVLLTVLRSHRVDTMVRPAFLAAADTIHSDYEQTRVLAALVRAEPR
jgi:beta-lactamase regulating signal transducer with metallopeptidase domain